MKWVKFAAAAVAMMAASAAYAADPAVKFETVKFGDEATVVTDKGVTTITVICPTGIGSGSMIKTGKDWGKQIILKFYTKEGKPFATLEHAVAMTTLNGTKTEMMNSRDPKTATLLIDLPVDPTGIEKISVEWVDAYRK